MSYNCEISFKNIEENEIYAFFIKLKNSISEHMNEIADENAFYCPSERFENKTKYENYPDDILMTIDKAWAYNNFTYKYLYLPEHKILGVFSIPDSVQSIFDRTCYFQNSCDQDYDYDEWNGIPVFEQIANKWKHVSDNDIIDQCGQNECAEWKADDFDYYRRSAAYSEIWSMFKNYLFDDDNAISICLYNQCESHKMRAFVQNCRETAKKKLSNW